MENPYQAPQTTQGPVYSSAAPLTVKQILFTLQGRIPRRTYWLYTLITIVPIYVLIIFLIPGSVDSSEYNTITAEQLSAEPVAMSLVAIGIAVILYILMIWTGICIAGKRWHDRDKSAWWILITFIPLVGPIWAFVENGCLRGTHGDNRYGADPT